MTLDRLFYGYMLLAGLAAGAVLTAAPQVDQFLLRPYFWVLIAVALFEGGTALYRSKSPGPMLTMQSRLIGFAIGIFAMVAVPTFAGSSAHFL